MPTPVTPSSEPARDGHVILGATVRTLGAWPSGWRYPGAHRDPLNDPAALRAIAHTAEAAGLQFLYFGDWLATDAEFELTDPYLLARIEPFAAVNYLAAVTERIGLIATANSAHSEPYTVARSSASLDILSAGRAGLSVASSAEIRSAANFGWATVHSDADRFRSAGEFVEILRGLWDSWDDDAFIADAATGRLIDAAGLHILDYVGQVHAARGPLNVVRPPQGHPPIAVAGTAPNARDLATREADISFVSPGTFDEAVESYRSTKNEVALAGREPEEFVIISPLLPIVAPTRAGAWEIYDRLVDLVVVEESDGAAAVAPLPTNRTIKRLSSVLGVQLAGVPLDLEVPARSAGRFSSLGKALLQVVRERSGRTIGGERPVTYRHLLVAHAVPAPVLVGSVTDVADHIELWFRGRAVDGFTILSAFVGEQFDTFASLVVPELTRRGLFPHGYEGATLRDHLGLPAVPSRSVTTPVPPVTSAPFSSALPTFEGRTRG
ncbi:NtaA/DmoA family FMN-dependent monooxygenase [Glaciihabitans sp. dw_435]|uniref:NtaA/DmoA family FMN-dependent monooxygenase n=1 Tax=Glaciihabitans sp. dw_435 TaxID=2720081 RepID=UPI001BD3C271|nr:NtaA/DmoA family FMN-dependent monooxygenase [Glaciihabitans sp. dw_435]